MDGDKKLAASYKVINILIWIGIFILIFSVFNAVIGRSFYSDFLSVLIPSLYIAYFRSINKIQNTIDVFFIFLAIQVYSMVARIEFFGALGALGVSGIFAAIVFRFIDRKMINGRFTANQSGARIYLYGILIASSIGVLGSSK